MSEDQTPHTGGGSSEDLSADVRVHLAEAAENRAVVCRSLACGLGEPDENLYATLADRSLAAGVSAAVAWLGADARLYQAGLQTLSRSTTVGVAPSDLAAEYARLFTGPGRAAVASFASQYLDEPGSDGRGPLRGPTTEAVIAVYREEGLVPRESLREPGDDPVTQLEFLAWLCACEREQWVGGSVEEALRLRRTAHRFLQEYCEPWWPAFAERVLERARLPVYEAMVKLLIGHLAAELGLSASAVEGGQSP